MGIVIIFNSTVFQHQLHGLAVLRQFPDPIFVANVRVAAASDQARLRCEVPGSFHIIHEYIP